MGCSQDIVVLGVNLCEVLAWRLRVRISLDHSIVEKSLFVRHESPCMCEKIYYCEFFNFALFPKKD